MRLSILAPIFAVLVATVVGGCQTGRSAFDPRAHDDVRSWKLVAGGDNADVDVLAEDFYARAGSKAVPYDTIALRGRALLKKAPRNGKLHEVLGYDARLRADEDASWEHFMRALQDTSYDAPHVALYELLFEARTRSQWVAMNQLLGNLAADHPNPLVRQDARRSRLIVLSRLGEVETAKAEVRQLELLENWMFLGALDNDQGKGFLTPYPPEAEVDQAAVLRGRRVDIGWRELLPPALSGVHVMAAQVTPSQSSVAYLVTYVHSDVDKSAVLRLLSTAATRAWLNGNLVLSEDHIGSGATDGLNVPVALRRGWNELLVKSAVETGSWDFAARLSDEAGTPLAGLRTQRKTPSGYKRGPALTSSGKARAKVVLVDEAPIGSTPARTQFLSGRMLRRAGIERRAASISEKLAGKDASIIALYERALVLWDTEETGKALDALNLGVDRTDGKIGAFLVKRARFYRQKKLWDKALADLRAVTSLQPRAIIAEMSLAELFGARGWRLEQCALFGSIQKRWPDSGWVMRSRAKCESRLGYKNRALELYENAHALEPGHYGGLNALRAIYAERGEHEKVAAIHREQSALQPRSTVLLVTTAKSRHDAGDFDGAVQLLNRALERDPDWASPHVRLGNIAFERGKRELALSHWRSAIDRNPDDTRLADHIDFLAPDALGIVERFIPDEATIEAAIARGQTHVAAPGSNIIMLLDHEVTDVAQDGSAKAVVTVVQRAANKKGRDALIERKIPRGGKVKLLRAFSRGVDGREQEASSVRNGSVRFRNITAGSTIVIQYVHNRPPQPFLPNHFVSSWFFQGVQSEYLNSKWVLIVPTPRKLSVEVIGDGIALDVTEVDGNMVRTFSSVDREPFFGEPLMPPLRDLLAHVNVSTVDGWDEYVRWERALLKNAFTSNPQLVALAKKLVGSETEPAKKLDRLFHYVAEEIRYQQDYENTIAGVRPHACPIVLERGYGDCKDKAVLLILLARHVGIDVDFAILRTTPAGKVRTKTPNQQFNHAIVFVPDQPGIPGGRFLDPTTDGLDLGNLRSDDQGAKSLVLDVDTGKYEFRDIPYQEPRFENETLEISVDVRSSEVAKAVADFEWRGRQASQLRRLFRDEETSRKIFDTVGNSLFSGAAVEKGSHENHSNIWKPVKLHLDMDTSAGIQPLGENKRIVIPARFSLRNTVGLLTRRHPLRLGIKAMASMKVTVQLPRGAKAALVPGSFEIKHACFAYKRTVTETNTPKGVQLVFETNTVRTCTEVSVAQYPEYRTKVLEVLGRLQDPLGFSFDRTAARPTDAAVVVVVNR